MICLITPTGSRPSQFRLCQYFMQRQTYAGRVVWIVIDDAVPVTTERISAKENWEIVKVYPEPVWEIGQNTQLRNIKAGIEIVKDYKDIETIFIIEDDDYYKPVYLEMMIEKLRDFDIAGEKNTIYYNVVSRRYCTNPNVRHSSLFQTAFKPSEIPLLESSYWHKFIDCEFWTKPKRKNLFNDDNLSIGIKGIAGRAGIGAGHKSSMNMTSDINLIYLRSLIGKDAEFYEGYYRAGGVQQHRGTHSGFLR